MKLPNARLTISLSEYHLLKPGLDLLANGLAEVKLGSFPHRHPWHRIDFEAANVHRPQAFDPEMAERVMSLRRKLGEPTTSRKVRLDVIELAAAALALRLLARSNQHNRTSIEGDTTALTVKLERYRKRAMRAVIRVQGALAYRKLASAWRRFVSWSRYNLLYFEIPKRERPFQKQLWKRQREDLTKMIERILADRCYGLPEGSDLMRMVNLAKRSFRRGRHSLTLRELLESGPEAEEVLFDFVNKRLELIALPGAAVPYCIAAAERGERFRAVMLRRHSSPRPPLSPADTKMTRVRSTTEPVETENYRRDMLEVGSTTITLSDVELSLTVAKWFRDNVHRHNREAVMEQAKFQIAGDLRQYAQNTTSRLLLDLIREVRPPEDPDSIRFLPDLINHHVNWLLRWVFAIRPSPMAVYAAITSGFGQAGALDAAS